MEPEPSSAAPARWKYPIGLIAVLAPLAIIWKVDVGMAGAEYQIVSWSIGYNGEYFRHHHTFPATLQTSHEAGAAAPVFYGYLLFKIAGVLSLIGGPHLAVRILAAFCCASAYLSVRRAFRAFRATEGLATAAAVTVCWAVYPLTNLYDRCAFAEFFAASCLTASCCLWVEFFLRPRRTGDGPTALGAGFFFVLSAGSHPITGMLSGPFLVALYLLQWAVPVPERPGAGRRHGALLLVAALTALVLAPWLYAYAHLGQRLAISGTFAPGLSYFGGGNWTGALIRLAPVPVDYQQLHREAPPLGVAHLDTQLNLPLLVLEITVLAHVARGASWAGRGRLTWVLGPLVLLGLGAFVVSVWRTKFESHSSAHYPDVLNLLWKAQFAYRLVTCVNLSVLLALLAALAYRRATAPPGAARAGVAPFVLGAVIALSASAFLVKLVHGNESVARHWLPLHHSKPGYEQWLLTHPYVNSWDYSMPDHPALPPHSDGVQPARFPIGTGTEFGRVLPLRVATERPLYIGTQAVPFAWATFRVNGEPVPPTDLRLWYDLRPDQEPTRETLRVAVPVPAGGSTIECVWTPPEVWTRLDALAPWVLACWGAGLVCGPVFRRRSGAVGTSA